MNENNQPQSQQTKREPGFYHIKIRQYGPRGTDGHEPRINDKWTIAIWDGKDFEEFNELYHEDEVVEIDERRIERKHDNSCPYCAPDGTIWNGDSSRICPHCDGSHVFDPIAERDKRIKELEAALKLTWLALRAGDTDEQIKAIEQAKPYIK